MKVAGRLLCVFVLFAAAVTAGQAQNASSPPAPDPRVGLKPGLRDAGEAARNMERIASLPKPDGFFDPKAPAGPQTAPERPAGAPAAAATPAPGAAPATPAPAPATAAPGPPAENE